MCVCVFVRMSTCKESAPRFQGRIPEIAKVNTGDSCTHKIRFEVDAKPLAQQIRWLQRE